jgi:hypothetical protein
VDPLTAWRDRALTELTADELMALTDEFEKRGMALYCSLRLPPESWPLLGAAAIYTKTFLETLAQRHADALADFVETRVHRKASLTSTGRGWTTVQRRRSP